MLGCRKRNMDTSSFTNIARVTGERYDVTPAAAFAFFLLAAIPDPYTTFSMTIDAPNGFSAFAAKQSHHDIYF